MCSFVIDEVTSPRPTFTSSNSANPFAFSGSTPSGIGKAIPNAISSRFEPLSPEECARELLRLPTRNVASVVSSPQGLAAMLKAATANPVNDNLATGYLRDAFRVPTEEFNDMKLQSLKQQHLMRQQLEEEQLRKKVHYGKNKMDVDSNHQSTATQSYPNAAPSSQPFPSATQNSNVQSMMSTAYIGVPFNSNQALPPPSSTHQPPHPSAVHEVADKDEDEEEYEVEVDTSPPVDFGDETEEMTETDVDMNHDQAAEEANDSSLMITPSKSSEFFDALEEISLPSTESEDESDEYTFMTYESSKAEGAPKEGQDEDAEEDDPEEDPEEDPQDDHTEEDPDEDAGEENKEDGEEDSDEDAGEDPDEDAGEENKEDGAGPPAQ